MRIIIAEDFLAPFTGPELNTLNMLAIQMDKYGLTAKEVIELCQIRITQLIKETGNAVTAAKKVETIAVCPVCQALLRFDRVNTTKCNSIGGSWRSIAICSNNQCSFTELSEKSKREITYNGL